MAPINSRKQTRKTDAKRDERGPGLVAFYDIRPGNGTVLFFQPRSPHRAAVTTNADCWPELSCIQYCIAVGPRQIKRCSHRPIGRWQNLTDKFAQKYRPTEFCVCDASADMSADILVSADMKVGVNRVVMWEKLQRLMPICPVRFCRRQIG